MSQSPVEGSTKLENSCISPIKELADEWDVDPNDEGEFPAVEFLDDCNTIINKIKKGKLTPNDEAIILHAAADVMKTLYEFNETSIITILEDSKSFGIIYKDKENSSNNVSPDSQ